MDAENFNLDVLISQMKELRHIHLGDQVKQALEQAKLGLDSATLAELVREFESDIEEHIERLERIGNVLTTAERNNPESISDDRRREIAFQSGCDFEDIDSLCEAFERARELLSSLKAQGDKLDIKLLFSNLPGLSGMEIDEVQGGLLQGLVDGTIRLPGARQRGMARKDDAGDEDARARREADKLSPKGGMDDLFDLDKTYAPKNRLPKDWNP